MGCMHRLHYSQRSSIKQSHVEPFAYSTLNLRNSFLALIFLSTTGRDMQQQVKIFYHLWIQSILSRFPCHISPPCTSYLFSLQFKITSIRLFVLFHRLYTLQHGCMQSYTIIHSSFYCVNVSIKLMISAGFVPINNFKNYVRSTPARAGCQAHQQKYISATCGQ